MSSQACATNANEILMILKGYNDSVRHLYHLQSNFSDELYQEFKEIFKMIQQNLLETKTLYLREIFNILNPKQPYILRNLEFYSCLSCHFAWNYKDKDTFKSRDCDYRKILNNDPVFMAIVYHDKNSFDSLTKSDNFDKNQRYNSIIQADKQISISLLELCCVSGSLDCFNILRTRFNSEITQLCLQLSFFGGNKEIITECLKVHKPDDECMTNAIISHDMELFKMLFNEYKMQPKLEDFSNYHNLEAFLYYFDQSKSKDANKFFILSLGFNIPSLCQYFILNGADINTKDEKGKTALHIAVLSYHLKLAEFLVSHGADLYAKDNEGKIAPQYADQIKSIVLVKLFISNGVDYLKLFQFTKPADGNLYSELNNRFKDYIETTNALFCLKTRNTEDLLRIAKMVKTNLIDKLLIIPSWELFEFLENTHFAFKNEYSQIEKCIFENVNIDAKTNDVN